MFQIINNETKHSHGFDVTSIRAFPKRRLSVSTFSMKLIICWLTWNSVTFSPNTNTHREWVITFIINIWNTKSMGIIQLIKTKINVSHCHFTISHITIYDPFQVHNTPKTTQNLNWQFNDNQTQALCRRYSRLNPTCNVVPFSVKNNTRAPKST